MFVSRLLKVSKMQRVIQTLLGIAVAVCAVGRTPANAQLYPATPAPVFNIAAPYSSPHYAAVPYPTTAAPTLDPNVRLAQVPAIGYGSPLVVDPNDQKAVHSLLPAGTRSGVFQKVKSQATFIPRLENDSIGITDLQASVVFGLPFFTRETPLVIEPRYRVQLLDGPVVPDLPARLHDADIEFRHFRRLNSRWIFDSAITVGMYADDHNFDAADAFRLSGRALGVYEATDHWKWVLGVAYLNRAGISVLPIVGLAYDTPTVKYEMVFPRPRAAWLLPGSIVDRDEHWVYVMGEFGGGTWAITRPITGTPDNLTMRDFRILFGYENKVPGSLSWRVEAGYVFARELEFDSATPDVSLDDTFLVRAGFSY